MNCLSKILTHSNHGVGIGSAASWIFFSAWCTFTGYSLSILGLLEKSTINILLTIGLAVSAWIFWSLSGGRLLMGKIRWKRYRSPFAFIYLICVVLTWVGGLIHAPSNYDAICYRVPRLFHWLIAGQCYWTGSFNARIDFSSHGFEWLMMPWFAAFEGIRFAFLINAVSFLLMPGLVFSAFRLLGVHRAVSVTWMWIIPCGACFVMQAGSIGNDFTAVIYVLSAIVFALKAKESGNQYFAWLSIISVGLTTCAKASNLPLMLPLGICLVAMYLKRPRLLWGSTIAILIGLGVSYAPLLVLNLKHTGDWTGSPVNSSKLEDPFIGLLGNTLQVAKGALAPPLFPVASAWNRWIAGAIEAEPLKTIHASFPLLDLRLSELASEEGSGLGLGVFAAMLLGILGSSRNFILKALPRLGFLVALGFWIATAAFMLKLGNPSGPRLLAPYYAGLLVLPLLLCGHQRVIKTRWWKTSVILLLLPTLLALLLNPSRPFLRIDHLFEMCGIQDSHRALYDRSRLVYETYSKRADGHKVVRDLLPKDAKNIGFAGTSDESEYSFWLPFGERVVRDLTPLANGSLPSAEGLDVIVVSDWGSDDRFGMTPVQMADTLGWEIVDVVAVHTYAAASPREWTVIAPTTLRR
jgi:hypothetical protein